jgi:HEAT repeat protein
MEWNETQLDRLAEAVEYLHHRVEGASNWGSMDPSMSSQNYQELFESRLRRRLIRHTLGISLGALVVLASAIGATGWLLLERTVKQDLNSFTSSLREQEIPQALEDLVGERLDAVVAEKSETLTESFSKEVQKSRMARAERYLSSNSRLQQIQGLQILRESDNPEAVDRVLKFMREKGALDPLSLDLRRLNLDYGVQALLAQGSDKAQAALRQIIADPGYASRVRGDAIWAAAALRDRKALPALREALRDSDRKVRETAIEAVVALKARETWPYLVAMLAQGKNPKSYPAVIAALRKLKVSQAADAVLGVVRWVAGNPKGFALSGKTQSEAISYFRAVKARTAVPAMFDFLMHPNFDVRLKAVAALRELTGTKLGTLEDWKIRSVAWRAVKTAEWRQLAKAPSNKNGTKENSTAERPTSPTTPAAEEASAERASSRSMKGVPLGISSESQGGVIP